mmetsp:Transcript_27742/g.54455  ORF Transcript_27742/g.54455 Transcript_27742/m.54455 type:complete len:464 (+) Transcript_27742:55-1446(+)
MESEYGRFFLAHLQDQPLEVELSAPALKTDTGAAAAAQARDADVVPAPASDAATNFAGFGEGSPIDVGVPPTFATEPWDDDNSGPAPIPKVDKVQASPEGRGAPTDATEPERPLAAVDGAASGLHGIDSAEQRHPLRQLQPQQLEPEADRAKGADGSSCSAIQANNAANSIQSYAAAPSGTPTVPENFDDAAQPAEHAALSSMQQVKSPVVPPVAIPQQSSSSQHTPKKAPNGSAQPLVSGLDLERAPKATGPMSPRGARPPPDISLGGVKSPKPSSSGSKENLAEIDTQLVARLDAFFANERLWRLVEAKVGEQIKKLETKAVSAGTRTGGTTDQSHSKGGEQSGAGNRPFRVQVPKPYPGVQYRKSKNLEDRYPRYAANGATVLGQIVDNGEWLKIRGNVFLPMRIGAVRILEPLPNPPAKGEAESGASDSFCNCCSGGGHSVASGETLSIAGNDAQPRRT